MPQRGLTERAVGRAPDMLVPSELNRPVLPDLPDTSFCHLRYWENDHLFRLEPFS